MNFVETYSSYYNYISLYLKPTTLLHIDYKIKKYFLSVYGNYNIYDYNLNDHIVWCNNLKKYNYTESFYKSMSTIIKNYFKYLYNNYQITNYTELIKLNGGIKNNTMINTWNIKEFNKFIKIVDNKIFHALFNTLFFTGMRKGEALALTFNDIKDNYIIVNKSITKEYFNGKRLITNPKSKKSIRKILIDHKLKIELNQLREYYNTKYNYFNNNFYIFGGIKPLATTTIDRYKNKYELLAGVKHIRIHDLRHSHATILYNHNIDIKLIQERLGHADISTTLNIYVHTNIKQEKRLIHTINLLRL